MSEKRKKRSSEIVNELSTSCKAQFKTPERNNSRVLEKDGIDGKEFEGGFSVNFMSPGQNNLGDRFIPKRGSAISRQLFNMPENVLASPSDISNKNEKEQNSLIFENLLEQKLLKLKYEHMNESLKDQSDQIKSSGFFANNSGSKSSKSQTTPVKKMNDQHFIIKRPKLLNFSDTKDERLFKEDTPTDTIIDSKVIRSIRNMRKISKTPFKVLDAPGLLDDFYQVRFHFSSTLDQHFFRFTFLLGLCSLDNLLLRETHGVTMAGVWRIRLADAYSEHSGLVCERRDFNSAFGHFVLLVEQTERQQCDKSERVDGRVHLLFS